MFKELKKKHNPIKTVLLRSPQAYPWHCSALVYAVRKGSVAPPGEKKWSTDWRKSPHRKQDWRHKTVLSPCSGITWKSQKPKPSWTGNRNQSGWGTARGKNTGCEVHAGSKRHPCRRLAAWPPTRPNFSELNLLTPTLQTPCLAAKDIKIKQEPLSVKFLRTQWPHNR